ncbi:phenylalanine--tRNA ligase subunit alpha [bacterium]|nr:phenylalanine--tRNA ligase subunit alpha [bacterium]NBW57610.1 phenylalanine--tRNA ligase subunit alpha [bacterium]NBX71628.1 phenylalanine--tRNA ligase subunit alpha [bacterium]
MQTLIESLQKELQDVSRIHDLHQLKALYLGKKGPLTQALKELGSLSPDERKVKGAQLNTIKQQIIELLDSKEQALVDQEQQEQLKSQVPDATLAGKPFLSSVGYTHPLTQIKQELIALFIQRGFDCAQGPDIESEYYNFEALNIPDDHPARQMHDTFYINPGTVLRTHTSPVQIRYLADHQPPIRMIAPGRVYRCDFDPTHTPMFHQLEGLVIHPSASLIELRQLLQEVLNQFFGADLPMRFRPSYFPFTEPSIEVDIGCVACHQKGCSLCKHSGWLEVLGCGMVHPSVLIEAGLNPEEVQGYAFGLGIERLAMLKLRVPDLRLFFENHLDFLKQFKG